MVYSGLAWKKVSESVFSLEQWFSLSEVEVVSVLSLDMVPKRPFVIKSEVLSLAFSFMEQKWVELPQIPRLLFSKKN